MTDKNRAILGMIVILALLVMLSMTLHAPDRRTPGEKIGDAIEELGDKSPAERIGDDIKDATEGH